MFYRYGVRFEHAKLLFIVPRRHCCFAVVLESWLCDTAGQAFFLWAELVLPLSPLCRCLSTLSAQRYSIWRLRNPFGPKDRSGKLENIVPEKKRTREKVVDRTVACSGVPKFFRFPALPKPVLVSLPPSPCTAVASSMQVKVPSKQSAEHRAQCCKSALPPSSKLTVQYGAALPSSQMPAVRVTFSSERCLAETRQAPEVRSENIEIMQPGPPTFRNLNNFLPDLRTLG